MGFSSWTSTLSAASVLQQSYTGRDQKEIFSSRRLATDMDPSHITLRESRDSEQNPETVPIIIGVDVTGSMGFIAETLVRQQLGNFVQSMVDANIVPGPQVMVMGIGDASCDSAPLQVSQFEPDVRMLEQLSRVYLEGGGGGNNEESYHLPWFFAATRTAIDSFEKRDKKGYLFTIGDEPPANHVISAAELRNVFGPGEYRDYTMAELFEMASEKYHVYHIIVEQGSYARFGGGHAQTAWRELIGRRAIFLDDYTKLADVIRNIIAIREHGIDATTIVAESVDDKTKHTMQRALID